MDTRNPDPDLFGLKPGIQCTASRTYSSFKPDSTRILSDPLHDNTGRMYRYGKSESGLTRTLAGPPAHLVPYLIQFQAELDPDLLQPAA